MRLKRWHRHFNPRSRKGSDLPQKRKRRYIRIFQSTLLRRERQCKAMIASSYLQFQSTLPRRERRVSWYFSSVSSRFQSTLPRRERPDYPDISSLQSHQFQSTLPRRERPPLQCRGSVFHFYFNPRSREGSDPAIFHKSSNLYCETLTNTTQINSLTINA